LQITLYDLQELLVARGEYPGIEHDDYGIVRQNIQLKKKSAN
jgi:hypothetical protein